MADISVEPLAARAHHDFAALLAIYQTAIEPSEQKTPDVLAGILTDPRYLVLVARERERVTGFLIAFFPEGGDFWLLEYMAVAEERRSQGTGGLLFRAARVLAGKRRPQAPCLAEVDRPGSVVTPGNDPARRLRFYRREGCRVLSGLDYILPLKTAGVPPPMLLLVHGLPDVEQVPEERARRWLTALYTQVYGCTADDPRIATMLSGCDATNAGATDRGSREDRHQPGGFRLVML